jgi:hypothetical protein
MDNLNKWLTLFANLGVVGGLILLAVQINQSVEITKAQMINDYYIADMQLEMKMMGENPALSWTKAVYAPDDLTEEDRAVLDRYFNFGMIRIRRLAEMRGFGLAQDDLSNRIDYLSWQFGNEVGRRWWNNGKDWCKEVGEPDEACRGFVEQVNSVLARADKEENRTYLDRMLPTESSQP